MCLYHIYQFQISGSELASFTERCFMGYYTIVSFSSSVSYVVDNPYNAMYTRLRPGPLSRLQHIMLINLSIMLLGSAH